MFTAAINAREDVPDPTKLFLTQHENTSLFALCGMHDAAREVDCSAVGILVKQAAARQAQSINAQIGQKEEGKGNLKQMMPCRSVRMCAVPF